MITRTNICFLGVCLAGLVLAKSARADSLFTFDTGVAVGTNTPFSITDNGITASFSSTTGDFEVAPNFSFASPFSGNLLLDSALGNNANIPLIINFSTSVTGVSLDFGTDDQGDPTELQLVAFQGTTAVGSANNSGDFLGPFPQGVLSFSGATFNSIALFDTEAPAFAIDNVSVTAPGGFVGVPEINAAGLPSLAMLLLGILALLEGLRTSRRAGVQPSSSSTIFS